MTRREFALFLSGFVLGFGVPVGALAVVFEAWPVLVVAALTEWSVLVLTVVNERRTRG